MSSLFGRRDSNSSSSGTNNIFHNIKKIAKNATGNTTVVDDNEFEALKSQFTVLHTNLTNLRTHLSSYTQSMRTLLISSQAISNDFSDILIDVQKPNPFVNQLQDLKLAHSNLIQSDQGSERVLYALIEDTLSRRINEELAEHSIFHKKIEERSKLRSDYLYYKQKLDELTDERNKRSIKGKAESSKDMEKFDRNQQKLAEAEAAFQKVNIELTNDINTKVAARQNNYGVAMNEFVTIEKQVGSAYHSAVKDIAKIEYSAVAPINNNSPPSY